ncbi:MAG: LysR family transcriptional regulator [Firmicutes bacterium]|nr:LysR family transcriptional regulator [Alicyclobacillaceae bacterium]MCL6497376.1 LysR family transcriptional regulator [Bacillota bacterium]
MNLEVLRRFVKIADLGTVSRAAEALLVAQPALSRQIHQLEREFGHPLFVRNGRYLQLTPFGQKVLAQARRVLKDVDALRQMAETPESRQTVELGASLTSVSGFLPQAVAYFRRAFPTVDLVIQTGLSADVYDLVSAGTVEVGVVSTLYPHPFVRSETLFRDQLWVVCRADHPLARQSAVGPEDLHRCPLVTMTGRSGLRQDLNAIFAIYDVQVEVVMEIDNVGVIQRMVQAGLGLTVLPRSALIHHLYQDTLAAIPFVLPDPKAQSGLARPISLIHLGRALSPAAQDWVAVCREVASWYETRDFAHLANFGEGTGS